MSEATYDDLAGIVDLFGALSRDELSAALDELAFKQGEEANAEALEAAIEDAIAAYYLVEYETDTADETARLTVGPMAFPTLPARAEDLPHILEYPTRDVSREELAEQVETRLRADAERAIDDGDEEEVERLLDVTYDFEAWANVDASEIRDRLDDAIAAEGQA
ncbi:hypothetical protein ACFQJC_12610 [Haloferax namakaokahaiae]|uniref:Uncharacterized protein n=1 Tax=Haloferax namakaokahaiae TaxID=1748331 RepID=A0ABD5ZGJ7_9EURY